MSKNFLFTSESVCAGHPDKICDRISDTLVDEFLRLDPNSRCGIETVAGANKVCLFGEVKSKAKIPYKKIVQQAIIDLGYVNDAWGFSQNSKFSNDIHEQSPEIAMGVDHDGAGDQGMMFGFACKESKEFMPLPIIIAHSITKKIDEARIKGQIKWLRPDGKAQVTISYTNGKPKKIEKLVAAVAHSEDTTALKVKRDVIRFILKPVIEEYGFDMPSDDGIVVNGTGLWHIPGPESDAGLTGRKIVVDTYGGYARVGGGAFSGKDPSKVDRSGAYAARFIAKNIVAHGLADKCEVGLAYVIGQARPLMQTIETFGTEKVSEKALYDFKDKLIDTSVRSIIERLDLRRPIYKETSSYGHFGRNQFPWEEIVKI